MIRFFPLARMLAISAFAWAGSVPAADAGDRSPGAPLLAFYSTDQRPIQTCADGSVSSRGCPPAGVEVATGSECPAASGEYCSDETPYCCGTPGNYYCATDVNHC